MAEARIHGYVPKSGLAMVRIRVVVLEMNSFKTRTDLVGIRYCVALSFKDVERPSI